MQRNVVAAAEIPDEGLVPVGFLPPEPVVEVGGLQTDAQLLL